MGIEREIKLALPAEQADAAIRYFMERAGKAGRDVPLDNVYFDTPALALTQAKIALRLRRTPDGWLQTLKAAGRAEGGLHSRHEWEVPVAGEALEVDSLAAACDDAQALAVLRRAAPELIPLFRTSFTRRLWRLAVAGGARIEAAIDRGEVTADVNGEVRRAPISEIELELLHGDESALHALAADLSSKVPGLAPEDVNKAQRGYRLRAGV
ncbi:CYTH domain-containing protein [Trinickia symbiotica]|uniref:CYTH domain-containing protein n=1 Tax=Trinickia symbiotica TaxID=863227 RepID=A0A2N7WZV7_9BURK|nr:CYTH domain-containing protein [Trinickia symbiotica]PMS34765.1 CYTH domain-containing protein [Trinickia symbiotica]PPK43259.1 CYTH domain-containing protein [Trinickia symbiotica]